MENQPTESIDYLDIVKRRKYYLIIPFVTIFFITAVVAIRLPKVYKSTCTILVEGQQIPEDLIRSTVTTFAEETIHMLTERIKSQPKLLEIINQLNLYSDLKAKLTKEEIIAKMRDSINIEIIKPKTSSRQLSSMTAFKLSFEGKNPNEVLKTLNMLASAYLEGNLKMREDKAKTTSTFLQSELDNLNENITQLEIKISKFKEQHLLSLPEMAQTNIQMVDRLESDLDRIESEIKNVENRKIYLEGQIATIDNYLPTTESEEGRLIDTKQRLASLYDDYTMLKTSLSEKHPKIIRLKNQIAALEKELDDKANAINNDPHTQKFTENVKNPAFISISTQIATAKMEIESLIREKNSLKEKIAIYQDRLEMTPQIELEYKLLTRDYDNARGRQQALLSKVMEAKAAEALERDQKGEKFSIIDPPLYPEKPYKPDRKKIILAGFALAFGAGVALTYLMEVLDKSIRSESVLTSITHNPVLARISFMETTADKIKKRRKIIFTTTAVFSSIILCTLIMHLFVIRLDNLWFKIMRYGSKILP